MRVSFIIGVATKTEEYVPTKTPMINANNNPLKESAPKMNIASKTTNVVNDVFKVLDKVLFNAELTVFSKSHVEECYFKNSLILSNTTTVSFKEYPITVSIAAINA